MNKVKRTSLKPVFPDLVNPDLWNVGAYKDSSHVDLSTGPLLGGVIVFIKENGRIFPIGERHQIATYF